MIEGYDKIEKFFLDGDKSAIAKHLGFSNKPIVILKHNRYREFKSSLLNQAKIIKKKFSKEVMKIDFVVGFDEINHADLLLSQLFKKRHRLFKID